MNFDCFLSACVDPVRFQYGLSDMFFSSRDTLVTFFSYVALLKKKEEVLSVNCYLFLHLELVRIRVYLSYFFT